MLGSENTNSLLCGATSRTFLSSSLSGSLVPGPESFTPGVDDVFGTSAADLWGNKPPERKQTRAAGDSRSPGAFVAMGGCLSLVTPCREQVKRVACILAFLLDVGRDSPAIGWSARFPIAGVRDFAVKDRSIRTTLEGPGRTYYLSCCRCSVLLHVSPC